MTSIPFPPERIEDGIGFLVNQLSYELRQAAMRQCSVVDYKMTPEGLGILFLLSRKDGLTQSNISEYLGKDKAMITRLLNSLEAEGLIRRDPDESDRRVVHTHLTEPGKEALDEIIPLFRSLFADIYAGIEYDEFDVARRVLSTMIANLKRLSDD